MPVINGEISAMGTSITFIKPPPTNFLDVCAFHNSGSILHLPHSLHSPKFKAHLTHGIRVIGDRKHGLQERLLVLEGNRNNTTWRRWKGALRGVVVACAADSPENNSGKDKGMGGDVKKNWAGNLLSWIPNKGGGGGAEGVLRLVAGATSSPICQFIDSPLTFLHSIDPKVKLVWLFALVIVPARSHMVMRIGVVTYLAFLSVCILPTRVWMDQLGRVCLLSGILFIMLGLGTDSASPLVQLRTPSSSVTRLPGIPPSLEGYSYLIMKFGPLQLTRKGLSVALTSACLSFTILQSASLCLATTTPEQLASALQWFMGPLALIGVPVAEIILTLLLSLRFINLVFDEVRNIALGIVARRIHWKQLTVMETLDVFVSYIRRIFNNIFSHAEKIAQAMIVRGFRGDSKSHNIYLFSESSLGLADIFSLCCLAGFIAGAIVCERVLI